MATSINFNGSTIYHPGAYSKVEIDLGGGFPLGPAGIVAIFGEADAGSPGANEVDISNVVFSPDQMPLIRTVYRSGPIVDACNFLFSPSVDGAIPSGAQAVYIYKTNSSVRASYTMAQDYGKIRAAEWGVGGNRITYKATATAEVGPSVSSSATFDCGSLVTASFTLIENGIIKNVFTLPALTTTLAGLQSALALVGNWSHGLPTTVTVTASGTNSAASITIAQIADATANRKGNGKSFELVAGSPDLLALTNLVAGATFSTVEAALNIKLSNKRDLVDEEETLGGNIIFKLGYTGSANYATIDITDTQVILKSGASLPISAVVTINKADYPTVKNLVDVINLNADWTAALSNTLYGQLPISVLDEVTAVGAVAQLSASRPARIKKDAYEVASFFNLSQMAELIDISSVLPVKMVGLPEAKTEVALSGGLKGASSSAEMVNALTAFTKIRANAILPLFSRDATADIADSLTDSGSTYTIAAIHQAVKNHISLMKTTKNRSERQGYLSLKDTYDNCKSTAGDLADGRIQLAIQDIKQIDAAGNIKWIQPYAFACLLAGARCGSPIGTPLTFKYLNCSGIRQTAQPMTTAEEDIVIDFDPSTMYDDAIQAGITFAERPQSGGFRVVKDNTTYGKDANWVWNKANSIYAADVLVYDFRNQMESIYVGSKNTITATEVKSTAESILATYLAQGITVKSSDAPNGFKDLQVSIVGDTIYINVTVKLVESIDFITETITLSRATSAA